MAATKKTVTPVTAKAPAATAAKAEEPKTEVKKAEAPTTLVKTESAKAPKEEVKKAPVKKEPVKKTPVKKETAKKAPAKKAELQNELYVQFGGKSYSQEDLLKIAKDVWKYDLNQKEADLTSVQLYVKPEEEMVYYVMNKEFTGSFYI